MNNQKSSLLIEKREELRSLVDYFQKNYQEFYFEFLYIDNEELQLIKGNDTLDSSTDKDQGIKARVYDGAVFRELALSGYNPKKLKRELKLFLKTLKPSKKKIQIQISKENHDLHFEAHGEKNPSTISVNQKIKMINDLHKKLGSSKKLVSVKLRYSESKEKKIFVNAYRTLSQDISLCKLAVMPFVKSIFGDMRYSYNSFCGHGYEAVELKKLSITKLISFSQKIKKAGKIKPGKYTCLLTPDMTGLLAHESFGHGMEADTLFKGRAKALAFIGKRLAKKEVSIADGPLQKNKHGFYFFDDEGTLATKTFMLKQGVVNQPIGDNYNCSRLKTSKSSNSRCESFDHKIYSRMSNTYFEPGSSSKKDMLSSVKEGLYLHNSGGGMEDPTGWGIQIQGVVAEKIKNGKLTGELFYEAGLTGYLPDVLKNIKSVSKEFEIPGTGFCGKGHKEWVRVSEGGPYLLIENLNLS